MDESSRLHERELASDRSRRIFERLQPTHARPSAAQVRPSPRSLPSLRVHSGAARVLPCPRLSSLELASGDRERRRLDSDSPSSCCPRPWLAAARARLDDVATHKAENTAPRDRSEAQVQQPTNEWRPSRLESGREMTVLEARQLRDEIRRRRQELQIARDSEDTTLRGGSNCKRDALEDDEDEQCCVGPEFVIRDDMTPAEILAVKKARRKEQCRVNQANYRKRKRVFEMEMDAQIAALQGEIDELRVQRNLARRQSQNHANAGARDPQDVVRYVFSQLSHTAIGSKQMRAPLRQAETIFGLEHEEFASIEDLLGQWRFHRSVFRVFELQLGSIRRVDVGDSLVLTVEATLTCPVFASRRRVHPASSSTRHDDDDDPDDPDNAVVTWPVAQRFVFDRSDLELAKIISEVDWVAGLCPSSPRPLHRVAQLVARSTARSSSPPLVH